MDPGRDAQELKRLRREGLWQQTRQSVRDHQEIKRRRARERAKPDGWDKGWLPEKVGPGEIFNGKNPSHYFQIPVMLMDLLIKNKRYGLSRCAMNLLNLIIVKTIGQFFSPINGSRVFWKLPKNSELGKMLKFKADQTSKAISFLSKLNVIIVKGYRDRWVCIHPRLYGISRDDLVKMKIDWDEIKPDRDWWVNILKGKIWHHDPKEENLSGREHVQIDEALERAIKYAEKNIKGFKCQSQKCRDKMNSGLEQMENWWKKDRWHRMRTMVFRDSNRGEGDKKLRDKLRKIKGPENLFGLFIFWVKNLQKERDWFEKITSGTFKGDGKPIHEFYKDLIQGEIAAMLEDYGGGSETLLEVFEDDKQYVSRNDRRKTLRFCPDGKTRWIVPRPSAPFGKKRKKS